MGGLLAASAAAAAFRAAAAAFLVGAGGGSGFVPSPVSLAGSAGTLGLGGPAGLDVP